MAINASAETIREMESTLRKTISEIESIQANIRGAMSSSSGWNDVQGQQYQALMKQIAHLTESPTNTLRNAIPKLEKLAQTLDEYSGVKM